MNDEEFKAMKQETDYLFEMMQRITQENERAATVQLDSFERLINIMRAKNGLAALNSPTKNAENAD